MKAQRPVFCYEKFSVSQIFKNFVFPGIFCFAIFKITFFPKEFVQHLIRVNHDAAIYHEDTTSKRLSVLVPFDRPQVGTNYCSHLFKFMCLGSDVGGINRRPLKVIFTLETENAEVLGRFNVDVRICSCPKRDKHQEESKFNQQKVKAMGLADGLARSNSVFTKPSAKKRKIDVEEFVMVPVSKMRIVENFNFVNFLSYCLKKILIL